MDSTPRKKGRPRKGEVREPKPKRPPGRPRLDRKLHQISVQVDDGVHAMFLELPREFKRTRRLTDRVIEEIRAMHAELVAQRGVEA